MPKIVSCSWTRTNPSGNHAEDGRWSVGFVIWFGWLLWFSSLFLGSFLGSSRHLGLLLTPIHEGWELGHLLTVQALKGQVGRRIRLWKAFKVDTKSLTFMCGRKGRLRSDSKRVGGADTGGWMGKEYDLSNCFLNSGLQGKKKKNASRKVLAK